MGLISIIYHNIGNKYSLFPFFTTADRAWYFNSWDKFIMPKPFAEVTLHFGSMIDLDAPAIDQDFEAPKMPIGVNPAFKIVLFHASSERGW
jgi:lysophospholipid acyltransferase (LPLAT)-like uncharacterized protein